MDFAAIAGLLGFGVKLFKLHRDFVYLQGQVNGALSMAVIALGLWILMHRPPPRS